MIRIRNILECGFGCFFFSHARIRPPGGFLPRIRLPDHYLTKIRPNGISFLGSACTTVTIPKSGYLRKPSQDPSPASGLFPGSAHLEKPHPQSVLSRKPTQDQLFLGNTFSAAPKSAHIQKPPPISTIFSLPLPESAQLSMLRAKNCETVAVGTQAPRGRVQKIY